jgi:hypothetical protein
VRRAYADADQKSEGAVENFFGSGGLAENG